MQTKWNQCLFDFIELLSQHDPFARTTAQSATGYRLTQLTAAAIGSTASTMACSACLIDIRGSLSPVIKRTAEIEQVSIEI
jgi:hypothetical protein